MTDKNELIWQRISQYQELLTQARAKQDREAEGHALDVLGHCYLHLEMWQEAGEYFTQALTLYQQIGERRKQGNTLVNLGEVHLSSGHAQAALPYFESARTIARDIGAALLDVDSLLGIASTMNTMDRYTEALQYYQEALDTLDQLEERYIDRRFNAWGGMGIALSALGQGGRARESFERALALARALGSSQHEAHTLTYLAHSFLEMDGGAERGLAYLEQAITLFRQRRDRWYEAITLADFGENRLRYQTKGRHLHDGLEALSAALEIASQIDDRMLLSYVLHAHGRASARLGHREEGLAYIQKALALNPLPQSLDLLSNAGKILFDQGQPEAALKYHKAALMRAFERDDTLEEEEQLVNVAHDYLSEGNFEQATNYFERALRLMVLRDDHFTTFQLLLRLATLYYYGMRAQVPKALALWRIAVVYFESNANTTTQWQEVGTLLPEFLEDLVELLGKPGLRMLWAVSDREYEQIVSREEFSRTFPGMLNSVQQSDLFLFLSDTYRDLIREAQKSTLTPQALRVWEDALTHFFAGLSCEERFSMEDASTHYKAAIAHAPTFAAAYTRQGKVLTEEEAYTEAQEALNQAIELDSRAWLPFDLRGQIHLHTGRSDLALADYDIALQLNPQAWRCLCDRAHAYLEAEDYQKAYTDCQRVLEADPGHDEAWLILGMVHLELGEHEQALQAFSKAIAKEGLFEPDARYYRGLTYLWLQDTRRANTDFLRGWQIKPEEVRSKLMRIWLAWGQKKPSSRTAHGWFDTAFLNLPDYCAYLLSFLALYAQNEIEDALYELDGAVKQAPERFEAHFWRGLVCAHLGKKKEAHKSLEQALALDMPPILLAPLRWLKQDNPESWQGLATFLARYQTEVGT
jgi:tetratricopeptide (TPR) repeat protein